MRNFSSSMLGIILLWSGLGLSALSGLVGYNHGRASSPGFAITVIGLSLACITIGLSFEQLCHKHDKQAMPLATISVFWQRFYYVTVYLALVVVAAFGIVWSGLMGVMLLERPLGITCFSISLLSVALNVMRWSRQKQTRIRLLAPLIAVTSSLSLGGVLLLILASFFNRAQVFQLIFTAIMMITLLLLVSILNMRQHRVPHIKPQVMAITHSPPKNERFASVKWLSASLLIIGACAITPWMSLLALPCLSIGCMLAVMSFSPSLAEDGPCN